MDIQLTSEELERYKRQIIISSIGIEGQERLKGAQVFIAGLGGLGSVSALYLVAAGIGNIRIIDKDRVDISNLNRQIIHWTDDLGIEKSESGLNKLKRLNPNCNIETFTVGLNNDNASDLIGGSSLIVDATDNLETRRILNRISILKSIPYIYGGVDGLSGMVTTFVPGETPCFDCIFPVNLKKVETVGVIGPTPGIVASIQAMEAIKLLVCIKGTLNGRLLYFSGTDMQFRELIIEKNPQCPTCSKLKLNKERG